MKDEELFELVKKHWIDFKNSKEMETLVHKLITPELEVCAVEGYDEGPKYWKVNKFQPLNKRTKLTVMNYLEFLNDINQNVRNYITAEIIYSRLETQHRDNVGDSILILKTKQGGKDFELEIIYDNETDTRGRTHRGYNAYSNIDDNDLEEIARKYVGPNLNINDCRR